MSFIKSFVKFTIRHYFIMPVLIVFIFLLPFTATAKILPRAVDTFNKKFNINLRQNSLENELAFAELLIDSIIAGIYISLVFYLRKEIDEAIDEIE